MSRRDSIRILAAATVAPRVPLKPRCDAAFIEAAMALGETLINGDYVIRRPIRVSRRLGKMVACTIVGHGGSIFEITGDALEHELASDIQTMEL